MIKSVSSFGLGSHVCVFLKMKDKCYKKILKNLLQFNLKNATIKFISG